MQTKDDEIIELYWKRDPKAIEETQTHYGEKLGRLSFGILENREDGPQPLTRRMGDARMGANQVPPWG